jgi:hypothetical protein
LRFSISVQGPEEAHLYISILLYLIHSDSFEEYVIHKKSVPIPPAAYLKCGKCWLSRKANPVSRRPWFSKKRSFGSSVRNLIVKPAEGVEVRRQAFPRGGAESTGHPVVWLDTFAEDTALYD